MKMTFRILLWICLSGLFVACNDDNPVIEIVNVTSVALNKNTLSLENGQSETLVAAITPADATNKKLIWISSDPSVATVDDNGKITALKSGSTTILVVTEDGAKTATCVVTCGDETPPDPEVVLVESISLNASRLLLRRGGSEILTATITPENATNKNVRWTSSDETIAKVDADGEVTALKLGSAAIIATTEDGAKVATCTVTVSDIAAQRTVLVYIVADKNGLDENYNNQNFATQDVEEMIEGMKSVDASLYNLLVYLDNNDNPVLFRINSDKKGNVNKEIIKEYGEQVSTDTSVMKEVLARAFNDYPADSYGLVYWSHCDGWIPYPLETPKTRWVGQDKGDGSDNRMNISGLMTVLDSAPYFDFIMFDACFMMSVEVAYELRKHTDYYIGSPTENPGPGAPYDRIVPLMFRPDAAIAMTAEYFKAYNELYNGGVGMTNANWTGGTSIAALKTEGLENLAAVTKQVLQNTTDISELRSSVFDYDKRNSYNGHVGYYDMVDMMKHLTDNSGYSAWKQAFDNVIGYWNTTPKNYSQFASMFSMEGTNGVTHYIPSTANTQNAEVANAAYRTTSWYKDTGLSRLDW